MLLYLLCNIIFIPLLYGSSTALPKLDNNSTKTFPIKEPQKNEYNKTKVALPSEGGAIISDSPVLTALKENHTILMSLEKELDNKNKEESVVPRKGVALPSEGGAIISDSPVLTALKENHTILMSLEKELDNKNKEKSVVPRKGVVYNPLEDDIAVRRNVTQINQENSKRKLSNEFTQSKNATDPTTMYHDKIKGNNKKPLNESNKIVKNNKTEVRKPLTLSFEELAEMDRHIESNTAEIPVMKSSSKSLVSDQSPNRDGPAIKVQPMNASRHPGMIMPVVITILVVPMFAILGYMALRRGHEAWKNRHYKRMDFLLDGMYND